MLRHAKYLLLQGPFTGRPVVELDGEGGVAVGGLAGPWVPTGGLTPGGSATQGGGVTGGLSFSAVCAGNKVIQ